MPTRPLPVTTTDAVMSHLYVERDVQVTARRSGLIERVLVDRGQRVRQGQGLAVLETDLAAAEVKRSLIQFSSAEKEKLQNLIKEEENRNRSEDILDMLLELFFQALLQMYLVLSILFS